MVRKIESETVSMFLSALVFCTFLRLSPAFISRAFGANERHTANTALFQQDKKQWPTKSAVLMYINPHACDSTAGHRKQCARSLSRTSPADPAFLTPITTHVSTSVQESETSSPSTIRQEVAHTPRGASQEQSVAFVLIVGYVNTARYSSWMRLSRGCSSATFLRSRKDMANSVMMMVWNKVLGLGEGLAGELRGLIDGLLNIRLFTCRQLG